jgi:hypothetical protein
MNTASNELPRHTVQIQGRPKGGRRGRCATSALLGGRFRRRLLHASRSRGSAGDGAFLREKLGVSLHPEKTRIVQSPSTPVAGQK